MSAIAGKGNKTTERRLRAGLVRAGLNGWMLHATDLPGNPDFVFPDRHIVIFVDGCFWHGCRRCAHPLRRNTGYWTSKIDLNRARDRRNTRALRRKGYRVIRFWEHDLERLDRCVAEVLIALEDYSTYSMAGNIDEREKQAVARVRRAGVSAPVSAVLSWVRALGPQSILSAPLNEILAVANAF